MVKSLGDYNKAQSSSNANNIKWTKKNTHDNEKTKKNRKEKISPTNIIPLKNKKTSKSVKKVFIIEEEGSKRSNNDTRCKKFQKSSVSNCNIKPGFRRPGR
ncbi:MAG: hypothetical protein OEW78_00840 [Nitrosopumilus sp.]|uniref:hypothetical protein n=1 Tax=Nitrosopumilus sp. TaxID=2024843 RepID=UPI00246DC067|nr:hypothetical protein [Nitrosopumilus sp.]MDH5430416.1 hypothetical protein [Nitrosopumilus sp.]